MNHTPASYYFHFHFHSSKELNQDFLHTIFSWYVALTHQGFNTVKSVELVRFKETSIITAPLILSVKSHKLHVLPCRRKRPLTPINLPKMKQRILVAAIERDLTKATSSTSTLAGESLRLMSRDNLKREQQPKCTQWPPMPYQSSLKAQIIILLHNHLVTFTMSCLSKRVSCKLSYQRVKNAMQ